MIHSVRSNILGSACLLLGSCLMMMTAAEELEMPAGNLVELNYTNFDEYTQQGTWIIEFYAPWYANFAVRAAKGLWYKASTNDCCMRRCGHCKQFAPVYEKAADQLRRAYT